MARYHGWANRKLATHLRSTPGAEYRRDLGLFFGSLHGTLNHILLVDKLWHGRFVNEAFEVQGLDQELEGDRSALLENVVRQSDVWIDYVESLTPAELKEPLRYRNTRGLQRNLKRGPTLLHVFNHGTHHRGQISAGLTVLGYEAPEIDLMYYSLDGEQTHHTED